SSSPWRNGSATPPSGSCTASPSLRPTGATLENTPSSTPPESEWHVSTSLKKPAIGQKELENITCPEGSTAVLECAISGEPSPEVTWYFEDTFLKVLDGNYRVEVEGKVYRLYISNFTHTDAGFYKCIGRNSLKLSHENTSSSLMIVCGR
uniref:Ig-like domain-containing protein n=1 Tax=Oryzias melastigma TaxID=30732 RepID=A0A3B3DFK4_ORYME